MTRASPTLEAALRLGSPAGRWTIAATVLGSGAVFLEGSVVHIALPAIGRDFGLGIEGLQWVVNGYLLTLSALMLLGGSLGDVHRRRRVFLLGLLGFGATSAVAALVPNVELLVAARLLQGAAGALLVPNSLALVDVSFVEEERGAAIGKWAGWSAITSAAGPLLGGWLVDFLSWRWVFASVVPLALLAAWIALRHVPDLTEQAAPRAIDYRGAGLATLGLAGVVTALVSGPGLGFRSPAILATALGGTALLGAFLWTQRRARDPLLPLSLFRSRAFSGANLATLMIYAAIGAVFFLVVLQLQNVLGYTALQAGAALLPIEVLLLLLSPWAGRLGQRVGPRGPVTAGALIVAGAMLWLARVQPDATYSRVVLPAIAMLGVGLGVLVAPLTAAVLGAVPHEQSGIASAVNNAVARLAGLLSTALLPLLAGLGGLEQLGSARFAQGYTRAMLICAGLCLVGAVVALGTVRVAARVVPAPHPSPLLGCGQRRPLTASSEA